MSDLPLLTPVREAHRFDERALDAYLAQHVEGYQGGLTVRVARRFARVRAS
jgi:hypothetical protein